MTPLNRLPEAINKAQNEQEYILSTGLRFADKINPHEFINLCENEHRKEVLSTIIETIQRMKDLRFIIELQNLFYDNKITDQDYLKAYNNYIIDK